MFEKLSTFARRDAGDNLRAVVNGKLCVARAEAAGDALDENLGVGLDEDGHGKFFDLHRDCPTALLTVLNTTRSVILIFFYARTQLFSSARIDGNEKPAFWKPPAEERAKKKSTHFLERHDEDADDDDANDDAADDEIGVRPVAFL